MNSYKRKVLAMALSVCIILQTISPVAFAMERNLVGDNTTITENADGSMTITEKNCEHHTHNKNCGFTEATPCTHIHNETCGYAEVKKAILPQEEIPCDKDCLAVGITEHSADCAYTPATLGTEKIIDTDCTHTHDETCGFTEGTACTFDTETCEECHAIADPPVVDSGETPTIDPCTATEKCTLELNHTGDCVVTETPTEVETITAIIPLGAEIANQEHPVGTLESEVRNTFPTELDVVIAENATTTTAPVTWVTNSTFTEKTADEYTLTDDTYIYTAKIADGYIVDKDVSLPTITIKTVAQPPLTAPATGTGWTLSTDGALIIESDAGMIAWITHATGDKNITKTVTSVTFKIDVTVIPDSAFSSDYSGKEYFYNTALTTIKVYNGNLTIGDSAFFNCQKLDTLLMPEKVPTMKDRTLDGTSKSKTITIIGADGVAINLISSAVANAHTKLIYWCDTLTFTNEVAPPEWAYDSAKKTLTFITQAGLEDWLSQGKPHNSDATNAHFVKDVTAIADNAFSDCSSLQTVTFQAGSSLKTIGINAFTGTGISAIVIPNSVTAVADYAFSDCSSLQTVTFEADSNLKTIANAFAGTGISSIEIPNSVTSIEDMAFSGCTKLTEVTFQAGSSLKTIGVKAFVRTGISAIEIPNSVTDIGEEAFFICAKLTTVTFQAGSKLQSIGSGAFFGTGIREIEIPNSVTSIDDYAFYMCAALTKVTFQAGSKLERIGSHAFFETGISSIEIPNSVTSIDDYAFLDCPNLTTVEFEVGSKLENIGSYAFVGTGISSIVIPNSVTAIGVSALNSCAALTKVTFEAGSKLQSIGRGAFFGTGISEIEIPNSVTSIDDSAFSNCPNLTTVEFKAGSKIENIGSNAFMGTGISEIKIPNSVTSIGDDAFYSCANLKTVTFQAGSKLERIGSYAFVGTGIRSIEIPNSVTSIDNNAFASCANLKIVTFQAGSKLKRIGSNAFMETGISSIEIPNSVTAIGDIAFAGCANLTTLTMPETPPATIGDNAFNSTPGVKNILIKNASGVIIPATQAHKDTYNKIKPQLDANDLRFGIETDTTTIDFGTVNYGESVTTKTVIIKNTFTFPVTLTQPTSEKFIICTFSQTNLSSGETATFTITPKANLDADTHTETIKVDSTNGGVVEIKVTFKVEQKSLTSATVTGINTSYPYTGSEIEPTIISVKDGSTTLVSGTDYDVTYGTSNTNVGTDIGEVIFTLKGNYSGTVTKHFSITKIDPTVTLDVTKQTRSITGSYGDDFVLKATISGANSQKPTGTVTFKDGATNLATDVVVTGGIATYTMTTPAPKNYNITAEFTAATDGTGKNYNDKNSTADTLDISKANQTIVITDVTGKKFNDVPFTLEVMRKGTGAVTYTVPNNNGVLTISGDKATIVGVGTVEVTANMASDDNYNGATTTSEIIIEKATAPTITYTTASGITYGSALSTSILTGGSTEYGAFAWTDGTIIPIVENSGYEMTFSPSADTIKNYETITDATKDVAIKVTKADPAISVNVKSITGEVDNQVVTLEAKVSKVGGGEVPTGTVTFKQNGTTIGTAVSLVEGTATTEWNVSTDGTYKVIADYSGNGNYITEISETLSVDTTKQAQTITLDTITDKTYGDATFKLSSNGSTGTGAITYTSSEPRVISISGTTATIHKKGQATITVTIATDSEFISASANQEVTVNPKTLTIKVADENIIIGETPAYKVTPNGLVYDETISGVTFTGQPSNTDVKGTHTITPVGGTISSDNSNYNITYVAGTLTINLDTAGITSKISDANTVKKDIIIGTSASNVDKGKKFVTQAEMDALNSAITIAENAKINATTEAELTTANTALNTAIETFKNSIKTGTKNTDGDGSVDPAPTPNPEPAPTPNPTKKPNPIPTGKPLPPTLEDVVVVPTVDGDTVVVEITEENLNNAIDKAKVEAEINGTLEDGISVTIQVDSKNISANNLEFNLSQIVSEGLIKENAKDFTIKSEVINFTLDLNTVKEIQKQIGNSVTVKATKIETANISEKNMELVGNRPVFTFEIIAEDGTKVTDFADGFISVAIPYELNEGETIENITVYYITETGEFEEMSGAIYSQINKEVVFKTKHFSTFAVGVKTVVVVPTTAPDDDSETETVITPETTVGGSNMTILIIVAFVLLIGASVAVLFKKKKD